MKAPRKKNGNRPAQRSQQFPPGWDEKRVREVVAYYDSLTDDEWLAHDEAARNAEGETLMSVPTELVPAIGQLIANYRRPPRKHGKKKAART